MECLAVRDGDEPIHLTITQTPGGPITDFSRNDVPLFAEDFAAIAREVGADEKVAALRTEAIEHHWVQFFGPICAGVIPGQTYHMLLSLFTTAMAYGLRVGIEMEKMEMPEL